MFESWKSTNCKDLRKKVESFLFLEGHDKLQNTYTEVREKKERRKEGDKLMKGLLLF